jgi:molybdenum cofactor biosynthesis protein MoaC
LARAAGASVQACAGPWAEWYARATLKLYAFDGVDERLDLVPLAARRALDRAGLKLSLEGWRSLALDARRTITDAGSRAMLDVAPVIVLANRAEPRPERIEPVDEPPSDEPPPAVVLALGPARALSPAIWASLSALDRFALAKVIDRGRAERIAAAYDEIVGHSAVSTHLAPQGGVRMVDVSEKPPTLRTAVAESQVTMNSDAFTRLARASAPKGDVLGTARLAGIMAAKKTSEIVPLCHPIALTHVSVEIRLDEGLRAVLITTTAEAYDRTGVEMEAMVAASAAALTVYDMLKAFDRAIEIGPTRLRSKSGGRTGDYRR